MALDKNIAALLNENAFTVAVQFQHSLGKEFSEYSYVTDLPRNSLALGDMVLVPTKIRSGTKYDTDKVDSTMLLEPGVRMSIAIITRIDEEVVIEPDDNTEYNWVITKVDVSNYAATKKRNAEIIGLVQEAYTKNLRRTFAQQILGGLAGDTADRVRLLIGSKG